MSEVFVCNFLFKHVLYCLNAEGRTVLAKDGVLLKVITAPSNESTDDDQNDIVAKLGIIFLLFYPDDVTIPISQIYSDDVSGIIVASCWYHWRRCDISGTSVFQYMDKVSNVCSA